MKFLKFPDMAEFVLAFQPFMLTDEEGNQSYPSYIGQSAVDVVGVIWKPTGTMLTTEDGEVPEMAPLDGWHVNLSGDCPAELEAYLIDAPASPVRVFA